MYAASTEGGDSVGLTVTQRRHHPGANEQTHDPHFVVVERDRHDLAPGRIPDYFREQTGLLPTIGKSLQLGLKSVRQNGQRGVPALADGVVAEHQ